MESLNLNSKERELQLTQRLIKQRHSNCMSWFVQLETHLRDLYLNSSSHAVDAFKPAFRTFFGEEHQTFRLKMFHNMDRLRLQLERENLLEVNLRSCLAALRTQFKEFFASKGVNSSDHLNQCWQQDFKEYTLCKPNTYMRDLLETLDTHEVVIHKAIIMANLFPNDDANALVPNFNIGFVPNPGHAHFANNNNNNGWIEWDVPLGRDWRARCDLLLEEQVQILQTALHESKSKNQQWHTTVAEMHSREGTLMQYMLLDGGAPHCFGERGLQDRTRGAQIMPPKQMSQAAIAKLIADEVKKALDADRATRNTSGAGGPGNVGGAGGPERAQPARDCTFSSFMKCGPTQFHGKEGVVELCRWFEKIESTFGISECAKRNKVKFAAATL
ncbi:hypothetical protein Tco_0158095 [Tanacetum coccineum]